MNKKHPFVKKILGITIGIMIATSSMFAFPAKETEALFGVGDIVFDPTNLIQNTVSAVNSIEQILKELTLDGIANAIAKAAATALTKSIVSWINSGFDGNPAFITDLKGFLRDVADEAAANFIETLDADSQAFLCSPFDLDYRIPLTLHYYGGTQTEGLNQQNRCGLNQVFSNVSDVEDFINGNFSNGGWKAWFQLSVKPENNPYGRLLYLEGALETQVSGATQRTGAEVDWGDGFLSFKTCNGDAGQPGGETCTIKTPGAVINDQLNSALGTGQRQLELADEFNEIVNALVSQLAQQALTGAQGLLGVSQAQAGSGGQSYLDRTTTTQNQNTKNTYINAINAALTSEQSFRSYKSQSLATINEAESALQTLEACLATKPTGDPSLTSHFAFASDARTTINAALSAINEDLASSDQAIQLLQNLLSDAQTSTALDLGASLTELDQLRQNNTIHDSQDVATAASENTRLEQDMQTIIDEVNTRQQVVCG